MESQNDLLNTVIGAAFGAFFAWVLIRIFLYFTIRHRLKSFIVNAINIYLKKIEENNEWLIEFTNDVVRLNSVVYRAADYTAENFDNLRKIDIYHFVYLKKKEQLLIFVLLENMFAFETLLDGFCKSAIEEQKSKTKLSQEDVDYLKSKSKRIQSLAKALPKEINKITDLKLHNKKLGPDSIRIPRKD